MGLQTDDLAASSIMCRNACPNIKFPNVDVSVNDYILKGIVTERSERVGALICKFARLNVESAP